MSRAQRVWQGWGRAVALGPVLWAAACGGGGPTLVPNSSAQQQNVMVVDEGIDLSVADLQGRVAGAYTETCAAEADAGVDPFATGDGGAVDAGPRFNSLKQGLIAAFGETDQSCHLKAGIASKSDPLHAIAQYRDRWNAMIRANQTTGSAFSSAEVAALMTPLNNELMTFNFHGTSTSTTVAHENPNVRLVLVERELSSEAQVQAGFTCFVQAEINQITDLLVDPDVAAAAAHQPATLDADFASAMSAHHVGIVNESFGTTARSVLESMQVSQHCAGPIDLSRYFAALTAIDVAHAATLTGPAVLTVKAAGNDGAQINNGADALDCNPGDPTALEVGSYNPGNGQQNSFSNFGACVDLFAPGQAIVTMYAGGWLLPVDGTSFAAPLTARFASLNGPSPFAVGTTRQAVLSSLDGNQELPAALFPPDFFYSPRTVTTDALIGAPLRRPRAPAPTTADLHRVMGPLRLLRRLQGG